MAHTTHTSQLKAEGLSFGEQAKEVSRQWREMDTEEKEVAHSVYCAVCVPWAPCVCTMCVHHVCTMFVPCVYHVCTMCVPCVCRLRVGKPLWCMCVCFVACAPMGSCRHWLRTQRKTHKWPQSNPTSPQGREGEDCR